MDQLIEILKISIPPLIVFAITYYMLKAFFEREKNMRAEELKILAKKKKENLKIKLKSLIIL